MSESALEGALAAAGAGAETGIESDAKLEPEFEKEGNEVEVVEMVTALQPDLCRDRDRLEDAKQAAKEMRMEMEAYDTGTLMELQEARDVALGTIQKLKEVTISETNTLAEEDEDEDDDEEDTVEREDEEVLGLFDAVKYPSVFACYQKAREEFEFDVEEFMRDQNLDFYEKVRLINYIRHKVLKDGEDPAMVVDELRALDRDSPLYSEDR